MPTPDKTAPAIVLRDPATLIAYAGNARLHPEAQVTALMRSIESFGFTIPALIDEAGEIIAGHGRIEAAKRLGLAQVPTLIATGWTQEQTRAYRLADNRLAEMAEWDDDILAAEFAALDALDLDMTLGVATDGGGGDSHVTVNIQTHDADSFARSRTQVAATLARAVDRGRRNM